MRAKYNFLKQLSKLSDSFDNSLKEVWLEIWDDVSLLNNFIPTFEARSDAHTKPIVASEDVGKAIHACLLLISHIGHVVILHSELGKVEEEISIEGAFRAEICERRSRWFNV